MILLFLAFIAPARSQSVDSSVVNVQQDTLSQTDTAWLHEASRIGSTDFPSTLQLIISRHPYFGFSAPVSFHPKEGGHVQTREDLLFYLIVGLFIVFAILRQAFAKYFDDVFRLFFRTTLKQRQIKEQLIETPQPSLLFNIFFVLSAGLYLDLVLRYFRLVHEENFWRMYLYCCLALAGVYAVKFVGLKICGWLFDMKGAADGYIFVVFIVNKIMGIFLLPFLPVLAFSKGHVYSVAMALSWCVVLGLLLYRFILTYLTVRNQVRVSLFHFFLYICAFEIAPLLLIYRALLLFFGITT